MSFDINILRGVALVLLMIAFLAMWAWAWSDKRKADFDEMSQLPLEEDQGRVPQYRDEGSNEGSNENNGENDGSKE